MTHSVGIVIIAVVSLLVRAYNRKTRLFLISSNFYDLGVILRIQCFELVRSPRIVRCSDFVLYSAPRYERLAWTPTLLVYVVALGIGGKHLINPPPAEPATASAILSFASTIAGFVITYAPLGSDFTIYFRPDAPS